MNSERLVHLFRNGRNQALRIPRQFKLPGNEAVIHKEGNKLIVEPVEKEPGLLALLESWEPFEEDIPEIDDPPPDPVKDLSL